LKGYNKLYIAHARSKRFSEKRKYNGMHFHAWRVLLLSVVDNLDFSANRLTALETLLMLASQGAYQAPHFKQ